MFSLNIPFFSKVGVNILLCFLTICVSFVNCMFMLLKILKILVFFICRMLWGRGEITSFSNHSVSYQHHPLKTCHQHRPCQPDPTPGLCCGPLRSRPALRGRVAKCTAFPSELPESRCRSRAPDSSPNQGKAGHGFLLQPSVWASRVTPCPGHGECTHTAHSAGWSPHPGNPRTRARVVTRAGPRSCSAWHMAPKPLPPPPPFSHIY